MCRSNRFRHNRNDRFLMKASIREGQVLADVPICHRNRDRLDTSDWFCNGWNTIIVNTMITKDCDILKRLSAFHDCQSIMMKRILGNLSESIKQHLAQKQLSKIKRFTLGTTKRRRG